MRRDLRRFRQRRRNRLQMGIVFAIAVLGALILVAMRSCTDRLDGMYQDNGNATVLPLNQPLNLNKDRLDKLKHLLEKEGSH